MGARKIACCLERDGVTPPALSIVHEILRRNGRIIPPPGRSGLAGGGLPDCRIAVDCWADETEFLVRARSAHQSETALFENRDPFGDDRRMASPSELDCRVGVLENLIRPLMDQADLNRGWYTAFSTCGSASKRVRCFRSAETYCSVVAVYSSRISSIGPTARTCPVSIQTPRLQKRRQISRLCEARTMILAFSTKR